MKKDAERLGKSVVLGYPYDDGVWNLAGTWREADGLSETSLGQDDMAAVDWLLSKSCGTFYVISGSNWHAVLKDRIDLVKLSVCEPDDVKNLILEKKTFVFLDRQEIRDGIGKEIFWTFHKYPPSVLSVRHIQVLKAHLKYISGVAELIDSAARREGKQFVMLAMGISECILADLLYALAGPLAAVMKYGARRIMDVSVDCPFISEICLPKIPEDKYAFFVCNAFGTDYYARKAFLRNRRSDYYFLHGPGRTLPNSCLAYKPFILWAYPHAGTGRIFPVFADALNLLGIAVADADCSQGIWYDYYFRESASDVFKPHSIGILNYHDDDYMRKDRVLDIYRTMPASSCLFLHCPAYDMADILRETGSMAVVLMRDMRDIVSSNVRWFYGGLIKYARGKGWLAGELLLKGLHEGNHLETISRSLMEIRENSRVHFIKFEDVCADPVRAYLQLFSSMGITDDPYYIPEIIEKRLVKKISEVSPQAFSDKPLEELDAAVKYKLWTRKPGAWTEMFTEEAKEYFKRHDNGILKAFGYERDNEW